MQACNNEAYPHHLMGALPGSFNYATLSDTAAGRAASGSPGFMTAQVGYQACAEGAAIRLTHTLRLLL